MRILDELLGRSELHERIASLERERERLEERLAAEEERRRAAVRDRQEAEERVNQLEDRIAGLEGELARVTDAEDETPTWRRVVTVPPEGAEGIFQRLDGVRTEPEAALSACVHDELPAAVRERFGEHAPAIAGIAPCLVYADDLGLVEAAVDPPLPPDPFLTWADGFEVDPSWFAPVGPGTFALARADLFALGRFRDGTLAYRTGFESDVMGRHSKGGFSQARFERRRGEQIDAHVERCREALAEDREGMVILVGDRRVVGRLGDEATHTAPVDASGTPEDALATAFRDFFTTRVYLP